MQIIVYTFENKDGSEETFQTQSATEAEAHAAKYSLRCIANKLVFDDSEIAWDFTGNAEADEDEAEDDGNPASEDSIEDEAREP